MKWRLLVLTLFVPALAPADPAAVAVGTHALVGRVSGLEIAVMAQGPVAQVTPLQVACLFEYTEGDLTNPPALPPTLNGMLHLDRALGGVITTLRESGRFPGHELETLLLQPAGKDVAAERVLLVGLGARGAFSPDVMTRVGEVGMREALRLGVSSYSHASDLKDAGVDSPTGAVAQNVIRGAVKALSTQRFLQQGGFGPAQSVKRLTLLAGPAFYKTTLEAARGLVEPN
jgi:hypothetical protein